MKATIVSLYPLEFHEVVPFLFPSVYHIDPSDGQIPKTLVIGEAFYLIPNPTSEDHPPIRITKTGHEIAKSLVSDFLQSSVHTDENAFPAVFVIKDEVSPDTILRIYKDEVAKHQKAQQNWLKNLIRIADDDWQKYRQHRAISDLHRLAARLLNVDREWAALEIANLSCPACGTKVVSTQAVCHNCRCIINPEAYKNLKFAEAK